MITITVDLGERGYPIYIGSGLLGRAGLLDAHLRGRDTLIVTNVTVGPLYLDRVRGFGKGRVEAVLLPDGEAHKNMVTTETVLDALVQHRFGRDCVVLALGGGVVGDIAGFAAAIYQRGVDFIQVPTTLLAQVDSAVGGKTGVNHPGGKNLIGAFHQPLCVVSDSDTLRTLPDRELSAGLAEVVKYGLIADAQFFAWTRAACRGAAEARRGVRAYGGAPVLRAEGRNRGGRRTRTGPAGGPQLRPYLRARDRALRRLRRMAAR